MKILALHGYTQSGPGFQRKIKRLQLHLSNVYPGAEFCFPTGPIQLRPSEKIPLLGAQHHDADAGSSAGAPKGLHDRPDPDDIDAFAWFALHGHCDPPIGYLQSLDALADVLRVSGPFDGILGFSQGALLAVMVASLLEGSTRRAAFARAGERSAEALPFPESFKNLKHPPLKFGITYGALMGVGKKYAAFYGKPRIQTPFVQFSGRWDPVVGVEMAQAVQNARIGGSKSVTVFHPGAHIVCTGVKYLDAVVDFIKGLECESASQEAELRQALELQYTLVTGRLPPTKELCSDDSTQSLSDESERMSEHVRPNKFVSKNPVGGTACFKCIHRARVPPHLHDVGHRATRKFYAREDDFPSSPGTDLSSTDEERELLV